MPGWERFASERCSSFGERMLFFDGGSDGGTVGVVGERRDGAGERGLEVGSGQHLTRAREDNEGKNVPMGEPLLDRERGGRRDRRESIFLRRVEGKADEGRKGDSTARKERRDGIEAEATGREARASTSRPSVEGTLRILRRVRDGQTSERASLLRGEECRSTTKKKSRRRRGDATAEGLARLRLRPYDEQETWGKTKRTFPARRRVSCSKAAGR